MRYRVINLTRNTLLASEAVAAVTFFARFKGLMGTPELPSGHGLFLKPCSSVHTFFMRIPIDVIFLSADLRVVDMALELAPWRVSRVYFEAQSVLELPSGSVRQTQTAHGDQLEMVRW